jgi:hypothetical protein
MSTTRGNSADEQSDETADALESATDPFTGTGGSLRERLSADPKEDAHGAPATPPHDVPDSTAGEVAVPLESEYDGADSGPGDENTPAATEPEPVPAPEALPEPEPEPKPRARRGGGPNPFVVIGIAFLLGVLLAKIIDWRGHAHPR